MRVVSETTESNASSSMAATCGSTMSLLAAGVPLKRMVGGIGIGIVNEGDDYKLLKDLSGFEDFNGDMDFKVTGTSEGITAIQLDVKFEGLTMQMIKETLELAEHGYLEIIENMKLTIAEPAGISQYAPLLECVQINIDQIGTLIGPSGKTIKKICDNLQMFPVLQVKNRIGVWNPEYTAINHIIFFEKTKFLKMMCR